MKKFLVLVFAVAVIAPAAMAQQRGTAELISDGWVLWDYPAIPTTTQPDTVTSVDYAWAPGGSDTIYQGNQALYVGDSARAWYRFSDTPAYGELSILVYDKGASHVHASSTYGPRWGVQNNPAPNPTPAGGTPNDQLMCVEMTSKSYIDGNVSYAFINANESDTAASGSHFSQLYPGSLDSPAGATGGAAARRVAGTLPADVATYDPADNVQGAWARWTFEVHDGEDMIFKVSDPDGSNEQAWIVVPTLDSVFDTGFSTTGFTTLFIYGGRVVSFGEQDHVGVWIDDVAFTPDAGQGVTAWSENFDAIIEVPCAFAGAQGDFNCDGEVGLLDLDILGQNWGATGVAYAEGDASGDGEVGLLDLDILGQNWGTTGLVPEPATFGLLAIGGLVAIRRR